MRSKDKRSILFCFLLGDGSLSNSGLLTIRHSVKDNDYVAWKTNILSKITDKDTNIRSSQEHLSFSFFWNKLNDWRHSSYKDGKKCLDKILQYVEHPWMAIAIWMADDGWVDKEGRIHIKSKNVVIEDMKIVMKWFSNLGVEVKYLKYDDYYIFKFNRVDSGKIWHETRETLLEIRSMRIKFSLLESRHQAKLL